VRLLYVEDDRVNAILFEQLCLQDPGLEVRCADSGADAFALVADWQPDVLVLDLHLPDTDGFALLAKLRDRPALRAAPAFLCTAEDTADVLERALASGFDGCWAKPIEFRAMRAALGRLGRAD
jgi:CheY-like chemotaxis protein